MVIATHEMGFAREVADEVCFLQDGRIVERGRPSRSSARRSRRDPALPGAADQPVAQACAPRWTSPASSATARPVGECHQQPAGARRSRHRCRCPAPNGPACRAARRGSGRRRESPGRAPPASVPGSPADAPAWARSSAASRPSVAARSRSSAGSCSSAERDVDADAEHRPALLRASLDKDARDLAPVDQDVIRPLQLRLGTDQLGHRDAGGQRQQRPAARPRGSPQEHSSGRPGRRAPGRGPGARDPRSARPP